MFHKVSYWWFTRTQYIPRFVMILQEMGKVVKEICTRLDGCPIVNNVCVDYLTEKNQWGSLMGVNWVDFVELLLYHPTNKVKKSVL